jgi:hypothetical protein
MLEGENFYITKRAPPWPLHQSDDKDRRRYRQTQRGDPQTPSQNAIN